ncbi:hypothetical protein AURDEDRAFT_182559 [Auricularia subglabra TFB-10046 SS5]|nr:hypothetical protein AURDEDRAFT_182559 [Auricularia subglabra TFB-10046 SS5]
MPSLLRPSPPRRARTEIAPAMSPFEHSHSRVETLKSGWLDTYDPLSVAHEQGHDALDYFSLPRECDRDVEILGEGFSFDRRDARDAIRASEPLQQLLMRSGKYAQHSHSVPTTPLGHPATRRRAGGARHQEGSHPPSSAALAVALQQQLYSRPGLQRASTAPDLSPPSSTGVTPTQASQNESQSRIKVKVRTQTTGDIRAFRFPPAGMDTTLSALANRACVDVAHATLHVSTSPPGLWESWDAIAIANDAELEARLRDAHGTLRLVAVPRPIASH